MNEVIIIVILAFFLRLALIASATMICYWSYKLFVKGIFPDAGDVNVIWGDKKMLIRRAAPGTFFVLLGTMILALLAYKSISFHKDVDSDKEKEKVVTSSPVYIPDSLENK